MFLSIKQDSSEEYNYDSMGVYEEIDGLREFMTPSSGIQCELPSKPEDDLWPASTFPPSILRPPDISEILINIWSKDERVKISDSSSNTNSTAAATASPQSSLDYPSAYKNNKRSHNNGSSRCLIPRPKVGWPSRKVTFGKNIFTYIHTYTILEKLRAGFNTNCHSLFISLESSYFCDTLTGLVNKVGKVA